MKKQDHAAGARPSKPGALPRPKEAAPAGESAAPENPKNQKLYQSRIEELKLPQKPVVAQFRPIRQFQLAHLAATLARGSDEKTGPSQLAAKALAIWNASGRALHIEGQASVLVCGLFHYNRQDWEMHGKALVASLDDLDGAVPGHNPSDAVRQSYEKAQKNAGLAVSELWKRGPDNTATLKYLFPGKGETEESRTTGLIRLLEHAKATVESSDSLKWQAHDGDFLKASILRAWEPLGVYDEKVFDKALKLVEGFLAKPEAASKEYTVAFYPFVARWLTVMRQDQLAKAKNRA